MLTSCKVFDAESGQVERCVLVFPPHPRTSCFSRAAVPEPEEGLIVVGSGSGHIQVWDYTRGELVRVLQEETGEYFHGWTLKGDILVTGSETEGDDGFLRVIFDYLCYS